MSSKLAKEVFTRLARVEERVTNLMTWQKWQMGILAAILIAVVVKRI